jgi:hypothetical protein
LCSCRQNHKIISERYRERDREKVWQNEASYYSVPALQKGTVAESKAGDNILNQDFYNYKSSLKHKPRFLKNTSPQNLWQTWSKLEIKKKNNNEISTH